MEMGRRERPVADCELCGRSPVLGGSAIRTNDDVIHPFCHPVSEAQRDGSFSCYEMIVYAIGGRRPPRSGVHLREDLFRRAIIMALKFKAADGR